MNYILKTQFGNIVSSYLGPYKRTKCVIDEDVHMVKCPFQLLEIINFNSELVNIIEDVLRLHHEQFNCSTTTLLAMWYFWLNEFQRALDEGCSFADIVERAQNILEDLISDLSELFIKCNSVFDTMFHKSDSPSSSLTYGQQSVNPLKGSISTHLTDHPKISNQVPVGIRFSSRHFSPFSTSLEIGEEFVPETSMNEKHSITITDSLKEEMNKLVHRLSHGDMDFSNLILKIWLEQITFSNNIQFNVKGINISSLSLPSTYSTVVDGLIVKSSLNSVMYQDFVMPKQHRALVTRSITFDHVHLGNSFKVNVTKKVSPNKLEVTEKDQWVKKCCNLLFELKVNLLLINGEIDPEIESFCSSESILVLHNISTSSINVISEFLVETPSTYLLDCDSEDILLNISVEKWSLRDNLSLSCEEYFNIKIKDPADVKPLTVFLSHPNNSALNSMIHQFWHEAHRLHLATVENKVIPGCGETENWCYNKLLSRGDCAVNKTIAEGFQRYYKIVSQHILQDDLQEKFDEVTSKVQAWKSAMALCLLTLQINDE